MSDEIKYDSDLELINLQKEINKLKVENSRLKEIIVENQLEEELEFNCKSVEESLCVNGINHIAQLVEAQDYDKNDIASFEKLFNILRAIRGKSLAGNKKVKNSEVAELLSIVGNKK